MPWPRSVAHLAGLRARLELELDRAVERLDRDRRAERGLDDREVDLREDVVALAHEALVGPDAHARRRGRRRGRRARRRGPRRRGGCAGRRGCRPGSRPRASRSSSVRPAPAHVSHGCSIVAAGAAGTRGRPTCGRTRRRGCARPAGAGRCRRSAGRSTTFVPGCTPSPSQVAHVTATSSLTSAVVPRAASTRSISISAGDVGAARRGRPAAAEEVVAEERGEEVAEAAEVEVRRLKPPERRPAWP